MLCRTFGNYLLLVLVIAPCYSDLVAVDILIEIDQVNITHKLIDYKDYKIGLDSIEDALKESCVGRKDRYDAMREIRARQLAAPNLVCAAHK
jgi:hypothetical protein